MTAFTPLTLLALCVWDEARGEIADGKAAVARVVVNRARLRFSSDGTIQGTVLAPGQFSGFWFDMIDGKYTRVAHTLDEALARANDKLVQARKMPGLWGECLDIAQDVQSHTWLGGPDYLKLTDDTVFYYNPAITPHTPAWAKPAQHVADIGHHSFFRAPIAEQRAAA
jgi:spore germination cell wall hydrolase CwlJ-like protein